MQTSADMFTSCTLRRRAAGVFTSGRWIDGAETESTIVASVQPLTSDELLQLPEGDRSKGARRVYTESELQAGDESAGLVADRIVWGGEEWEVHKVDGHGLGLAHYAATVVRVER